MHTIIKTIKKEWMLIAMSSLLLWATIAGAEVRATEIPDSSRRAQSPPLAATNPPRLLLRTGAFDPLAQKPSMPARLQRQASSLDSPTLHLIQFPDPIQEDWQQAITEAGLSVVTFIPEYAYLVWGDEAAIERLRATTPLRWAGPYHPFYALHPTLNKSRTSATTLEVTVQLYDGPQAQKTLSEIKQSASIKGPPRRVWRYQNLDVQVTADNLSWLAALPGVVSVEPRYERRLLDEVQGQILAGNLNADGTQPTGPGYRQWLTATVGFTTTADLYPIVDVIDDGFDNGDATNPAHPDFYTFGDPARSSRVRWAEDYTGDGPEGTDGHGTINVSIVGGYNDQTNSLHEDNDGYNYGLGINPFGRLASRRVFNDNAAWNTAVGDSTIVQAAHQAGARITSNSWGADTSGGYGIFDQEWDALTRDADGDTPGNQEMIHVFAAGNAGPTDSTTNSPGNAKNVITVGAAESYRPTWVDGCGVSASGADSAQDIISFSSRGPTSDGRAKPDLVAPGTHIQGAASQHPSYTGSGVCDQHHPAGQTLYAASSGTSHATPAAAGAVSLLYRYYQERFGGEPPSPAMAKAYLINATRYLTGTGAGGTLPSNDQGYGEINLGHAFDDTSRMMIDQGEVLSSTGESHQLRGIIAEPQRPFRVTLAWTDAPGPTIGAAYVNDLNLEVTVGGQTYKGNVFSGATSVTGGSADPANNVESVFLPAGQSGSFQIDIHAANIAGDGLPGNGDETDQDFALVIYNGATSVAHIAGTVVDDTGERLPGATVQAVDTKAYTDTTDANGYYTITVPVPPSSYTVSAWLYGYAPQTVHNVSVASDTVTTLPFTLTQPPSYSLTGCVTDAVTGAPLSSSITVEGPFALVTRTVTVQETGCYTLTLPENPYTVTASARLHHPATAFVNLITDTAQHIALSPTTTDGLLHGRVTSLESGDPVNEAIVQVRPGLTSTQANADGTYELQLPPDAYTVTASAPFYSPVTETTVSVPQSNLVKRDYALPQPRMGLSPTAGLSATLRLGERMSSTVVISNSGSGDLIFEIVKSHRPDERKINDPFGYTLVDEAHFSWVDAAAGTPLNLSDDGEISLTLPFNFGFYGATSSDMRVGNNGGLLFDALSGEVPYTNYALDQISINNLIAPFWDDLDESNGNVYYKTIGAAPSRRFVIEWHKRPHYNGKGEATVEAILYESTHNIKFQYQDVIFGNASYDNGASATIGIRKDDDNYLQYASNTPSLTDGSAICFQYPGAPLCDPDEEIPWLSVAPANGTTLVDAIHPIAVGLDAGAITSTGRYTASLRLHTNDPAWRPYRDYPITMTVLPKPPQPNFSADPISGSAPLSVTFTNQSTGIYNTCHWDFGDGETSSDCVDPSHTYDPQEGTLLFPVDGVYTVTLTVGGPGGAHTLTRTRYITTYEAAQADFTASPVSGTAPLNITFTNQSTGAYDACLWDFGDGETSEDCDNPSHTYAPEGTLAFPGDGIYTVTLTVGGPGGTHTLTHTHYITVYAAAQADFAASPISGPAPLTVTFTNQSTGAYDACLWDFGDGETSSDCDDPSHTYAPQEGTLLFPVDGVYTVTLAIDGLEGVNSLTRTRYITTYEAAQADFTASPLSGSAPLSVGFINQSTGAYDACLWNFGDGETSEDCDEPSHTYTEPGRYTVTLAIDGPGGNDQASKKSYLTVKQTLYLPLITRET